MKRLIMTLVLLTGMAAGVQAQQIHQLTQFYINDFAFNPAVAGNNLTDVVSLASFRKQWAGGFDGDAPTTIMLSAHSNFSDQREVGLGALLFSDKTGPTSRLGLNLAYAYHLQMDQSAEHWLSLGLSGTLMQYSIDFAELELLDAGDVAAMESSGSTFTADANFGFMFYGPNYSAGASVMQLARRGLSLSERSVLFDEETLTLSRHFFIMGSYRYDFDGAPEDGWSIQPSALFKIVKSVPFHFELNAKVMYENKYWAGIGYRSQDDINVMLGLEIDDGLTLNYSYDIITSAVNTVSAGSHEITLGYRWAQWNR